jgi:Ribulose-5-phosphate 4-epimerase and related epimerases and aldolases
MLESLRKEVLQANLELSDRGLALFTWGNASAIDAREGLSSSSPPACPMNE